MTAASAAVNALQIEVETLCAVLDVVARHMQDGPYRCEIERTAAEARARALVAADRAERASAARGNA